jgi:hypothetical protein
MSAATGTGAASAAAAMGSVLQAGGGWAARADEWAAGGSTLHCRLRLKPDPTLAGAKCLPCSLQRCSGQGVGVRGRACVGTLLLCAEALPPAVHELEGWRCLDWRGYLALQLV